MRTSELTTLVMLYMSKLNKTGPKTVPWGTPTVELPKGMLTVSESIVCIKVEHEIRANNMFQYLAHNTSKKYRSYCS